MNVTVHIEKLLEDDPWTDYYEVLHDFDTVEYFREDLGYSVPRSLFNKGDGLLDRQGYPEACRFWSATGKGAPLTKELQWYWFNLCMLSMYGDVYDSPTWKAMTPIQRKEFVNEWTTFTDDRRVLTNHAGTNIRANYPANKILGIPLKSGLPLQFNLTMGGNVVKVLSHEEVSKNGEPHYEIEVWNGKNPAPDARNFNWRTHPHLVHRATNSTPFAYDRKTILMPPRGPWRVDPFVFFQERGSPYALLANERQWISVHRVRRLKKSELFPRPYVP